MTITAEEVKKIAYLARLQATDAEAEKHVTSLSNILHLIEEMQSINTDSVMPMAHAEDNVKQPFRIDQVTEHNQRAAFQAIAPQVAEGLYLVPKVIE
jgi:aspartyl-tRNA(Asn)/glutamyl-tRNA(Gln) amidotransferase subunit C